MILYLYKIGTSSPILTIEDAASYTDSQAATENGTVYGPFASDCELSSLPDCSETLRADWRRAHLEDGDRIGALERKLSALTAAIEGLRKGVMPMSQ